MKKSIIYVAALAAMFLAACCGQKKCNCDCEACQNCVEKQDPNAPQDSATIVDNEQYDLSQLKVEATSFLLTSSRTSHLSASTRSARVATRVSSTWLKRLRERTANTCPSGSLVLSIRCSTTPIMRMQTKVSTAIVRLLRYMT